MSILFLHPTACVTGRWAGVDSAWEQEKLEARKMLVKQDEPHLSSARFVGVFSLAPNNLVIVIIS